MVAETYAKTTLTLPEPVRRFVTLPTPGQELLQGIATVTLAVPAGQSLADGSEGFGAAEARA
jgi:hypothetical protein